MHRLSQESLEAFVNEIETSAELVDPGEGDPEALITTDPDDNPIVQTAVVGKAEVICTLDRHFRQPAVQSYCGSRGIRIMDDVQLLQLLRQSEGDSPAAPA